MKADKSKMFSVSLQKLSAENGAPFPLYLFLRRNNRFVPIRLPGDPIGMKKYEAFLSREFHELWVPNNFQEVFHTYLDYVEKTGTTIESLEKVAGKKEQPKKEVEVEKSEDALLVRDTLEDEELTTQDKAQILSAVSQDLLRSLNRITTRGEEARAEGVKRCKEIADEVLLVASQNSNIYEEILALRNSQEEFEHSVIVGTIAVMFALAVGISDETALGDLALAAIFHDIGLVRIRAEVLTKEEIDWTAQERTEYEKHVAASVEILKESGTEFHPRVYRMVKEHHENYDGSGFPDHLRGAQIDELSQLLHLANLFDRLCVGKQTGKDLSPADAFNYISDVSSDANATQEVQPELVQRVLHFMLTEKAAADAYKEQGAERAQNAAKAAMGKNN
jgi:putative nucleotidyltransferase with HDIG domain